MELIVPQFIALGKFLGVQFIYALGPQFIELGHSSPMRCAQCGVRAFTDLQVCSSLNLQHKLTKG